MKTIEEIRKIMEENGGFIELAYGEWISNYGNVYTMMPKGTGLEDLNKGCEITEETVVELVNIEK